MRAYGYWGYPPPKSAPRTINKNGYGPKYRKYRALFTKLSMPAFPGEQGGENGVADQRGAG